MAEQRTQFKLDEDSLMQTDPIYLSSDEESTSEYSMSEAYPPKNSNTQIQTLSQFVLHTNDPTDV